MTSRVRLHWTTAAPHVQASIQGDGEERMMNIGRRDQIEESEDAAPAEMLAQLFEANGWPCEFVKRR
jgi:hypothetical protein